MRKNLEFPRQFSILNFQFSILLILFASLRADAATLAAHYDFNQGSGNGLTDVSGNGRDGDIASATWVDEGGGFAHLSFDGRQNGVRFPGDPHLYGQISGDPTTFDLQLEAAGSVEAWYLARGDMFTGSIVSVDRGGGAPSLSIGTDTAGAGNIAGALANKETGQYLGGIGDVPAPLDDWTHVAMTWDSAANHARLYLNGTLAGSEAAMSFTPELSFFPMSIGVAPYSAPNFYFHGELDEIKFWSGELSAAEVAAAHLAGRPGQTPLGPPFNRTVFDNGDLGINNGNGWINFTNESRVLSNGESNVLRAYMQMYRATDDTYYLDKLIDHADAVLANRDDFANHSHEVPGNYPIWSTAQDGLVSAPLINGLILEGIVRFARLVTDDPTLAADPTYSAKAATYIQRTQETVDFVNDHYLWSSVPGRSAYASYFDQLGILGAPHQDATMGNVLRDLHFARGDASLMTIAEELARMIQVRGFYTTEQGNLAWSYNYTGSTVPEDITHGAHAAPFLSRMAAEGRVVTPAEIVSLAASLIEEAYLGDGHVTSGMEGSNILEERIGPLPETYWSWGMAGGMIDFAQFDLRLLPIAEAVQIGNFGTTAEGAGSALLGMANLVRYKTVPQQALLSLSVQVGPNVYAATDSLVTLSGPTVLTLVNEADSGDVRQVSVELGGSGDEWTRQWDLSVSLDAAGAPDLIGGTVQAEISLQDRSGTGKRILTATPPAGYQTTQLSLAQAQFSGTMAALQSFMLGANEVQALLGFNDDGVLDATDIDLLYDAIAGGSSDLLYDLNNDALVDQTDVNVLIEVILETSFGDANLDQRVDDDDVLILRQNFGSQTGWAGGNFGPGNVVDANDFATLRSNYGFNAAAPAPATPEPTSLVLVGLAGLAALKKWRVEGGE